MPFITVTEVRLGRTNGVTHSGLNPLMSINNQYRPPTDMPVGQCDLGSPSFQIPFSGVLLKAN